MELTRRGFLAASALTVGTTAFSACSSEGSTPSGSWPDEAAWQSLRDQVGDRLIRPTSPLAACRTDPDSGDCKKELKQVENPLDMLPFFVLIF